MVANIWRARRSRPDHAPKPQPACTWSTPPGVMHEPTPLAAASPSSAGPTGQERLCAPHCGWVTPPPRHPNRLSCHAMGGCHQQDIRGAAPGRALRIPLRWREGHPTRQPRRQLNLPVVHGVGASQLGRGVGGAASSARAGGRSPASGVCPPRVAQAPQPPPPPPHRPSHRSPPAPPASSVSSTPAPAHP